MSFWELYLSVVRTRRSAWRYFCAVLQSIAKELTKGMEESQQTLAQLECFQNRFIISCEFIWHANEWKLNVEWSVVNYQKIRWNIIWRFIQPCVSHPETGQKLPRSRIFNRIFNRWLSSEKEYNGFRRKSHSFSAGDHFLARSAILGVFFAPDRSGRVTDRWLRCFYFYIFE